jgi:hypothetical protein
MQHGDGPDRPASDPQAGEHDTEQKCPYQLRDHTSLGMASKEI